MPFFLALLLALAIFLRPDDFPRNGSSSPTQSTAAANSILSSAGTREPSPQTDVPIDDEAATEELSRDRREELQRFAKKSNGWRLLCTARLRQIWMPKLRQLPAVQIELKSEQTHYTSADMYVRVRQAGILRGIRLFWDPDECDAGAPNGGWIPEGFDWPSPSSRLEHVLADAGNDCAKRIPW